MTYRIVVCNTLGGKQFVPQYRYGGWRGWLFGWYTWEQGLTEQPKFFETLAAAERFIDMAKKTFESPVIHKYPMEAKAS